jgi:hypothetical protein
MLEVSPMLKSVYDSKKAELEKIAYDPKVDAMLRSHASNRLISFNLQAQREGIVSLDDLKAKRAELDRQIKEAEAA